MKPYILPILIALAVLASYLIGYKNGRNAPTTPTNTTTDTILVYRVDTLQIAPKIVRTYTRDTIRIRIDSLVHDTTFVQLPREVRVYRDSLSLAVVSGYKPNLDTLVVYPRSVTTYITTNNTIKEPRLSIGLSGGYGCSKDGLSPYIGIGLNYRLLSFPAKK